MYVPTINTYIKQSNNVSICYIPNSKHIQRGLNIAFYLVLFRCEVFASNCMSRACTTEQHIQVE